MANLMIQSYDLVGDILSRDDTLLNCLELAGYECRDAIFHHLSRKAIALGDFTEGGQGQFAFFNTVKSMVDPQDYPAVTEERRFLIRCDLHNAVFEFYLPAERTGDWRLTKVGRLGLPEIERLPNLAIEANREHYRPKDITTLFIGESAPANGTFFYHGENTMLRQMRLVMEAWKGELLGDSKKFLQVFKAHGWYLDDLVLKPVNGLPTDERRCECEKAIPGLASRITDYQPKAIVVILLGITEFVEKAVKMSGRDIPQYAVPFPGMGWAKCFRSKMAEIIECLPTAE